MEYLINYLLNENPKIKVQQQPKNREEQFNLYRSLSNVRPANPVTQEYIEKENKLLQEYIRNHKTITKVEDIKTLSQTHPQTGIKNSDRISLWQGDITSLKIGAITNAANSKGLGCFVPCHNCIDNQINTYAGVQLRLECDRHMKTINYNLPTGEAFTTKAYNLPAEHVIHTVGPIISGQVRPKQEQQLSNCYRNTLKQAQENNITTLAFCSISTGEFHFPKDLACQIALKTVDDYLDDNKEYFDNVVFNVYSNGALDIYEKFI